jgi:hypothetical protein
MSDTFTQSAFNKQRKDKFLLVLDLPPLLKDINKKLTRANDTIISDSLQFSIYGAVVPRVSFHHTPLRYSGQTLNVTSFSREPYNSVKVNFTVDNMFNNYWVIYKWLDYLNNEKTSIYDAQNPEATKYLPAAVQTQYKTSFNVFGLDEYDTRVIQFTYTNALPVALDEITYSYRDAGQMDSSFEFYFDQLIVKLL